jgi:hypothetical protein
MDEPTLAQRFSGWTCFAAASTKTPWRSSTLPLAIRCQLGSVAIPHWMLWDTGSHWSVMGSRLAQLVAGDMGPKMAPIAIETRFGRWTGHLRRLTTTILASAGRDMAVDATWLVLDEDWPGPTVLGVRGFMERIRFGFDLGVGQLEDPILAVSPSG